MNRTEHLLVKLMEECDEVSQRASKALRFGLSEIQPGQRLNNSERIEEEAADLLGILEILQEEGCLNWPSFTAIAKSRVKFEKVLLFSKECGTLTE